MTRPPGHHAGSIPVVPSQVLSFSIGDEVFGVDILRVREIRGWSPVTRIANTPAHVLGVMNLRGSLVPIIDLRLRLSLSASELTPLTVIIVVSVESAIGERKFGLVVDRVSDVVDIRTEDVKPMPNVDPSRQAAQGTFVQALATVAGQMVILLNMVALVRSELPASDPQTMAGAA